MSSSFAGWKLPKCGGVEARQLGVFGGLLAPIARYVAGDLGCLYQQPLGTHRSNFAHC